MRKLNVTDRQTDGRTDGQTDGGRCNISRPGPSAPREIKSPGPSAPREIKTMDNKFYIYVKTLTSLAKRGPGGGGGGILVHIYPPFNNNLHVKYRSNLNKNLLS